MNIEGIENLSMNVFFLFIMNQDLQIYRVSQKALPRLCGYCGRAVESVISVLHICIGQALKDLFHPACLVRVVSWFAFVVAIFMAHENGDKQRPAKRRHVQGMLDETDPLNWSLRPCLSQSDTWLLIYDREKVKIVVASSSTVKKIK